MKKNLVLVLGLCTVAIFTSCKSRESAYRQAWEQAMAQDKEQNTTTTETTTETVVTPVTPTVVTETVTTDTESDKEDVRGINGNVSIVSGSDLKGYNVVVGSFITVSNAEALSKRLQQNGYDSRVIKTTETIKGITPWYRVIAASYDDYNSAKSTRNSLLNTYGGAWIYRK